MRVRTGIFLCVVLMAACAPDDVPNPIPRAAGEARFSVTSYNVHRIPPLDAARPKVRATIWGKNTGAAAGVPRCPLSYGTRGQARVRPRARVRPVDPGNHFEVAGTATFDDAIPGAIASEDAYCRAR